MGTFQLGVTPAERPEDGDDAFGLTEADVAGRLEGQARGGVIPLLSQALAQCMRVVHINFKKKTGILPMPGC